MTSPIGRRSQNWDRVLRDIENIKKGGQSKQNCHLYILKNPDEAAFYKLGIIFKASFPLDNLRTLPPRKDDPSNDHCLGIHGLQHVLVRNNGNGYIITGHKCRDVPYSATSSTPKPVQF